jgi:hypothetical protein
MEVNEKVYFANENYSKETVSLWFAFCAGWGWSV